MCMYMCCDNDLLNLRNGNLMIVTSFLVVLWLFDDYSMISIDISAFCCCCCCFSQLLGKHTMRMDVVVSVVGL